MGRRVQPARHPHRSDDVGPTSSLDILAGGEKPAVFSHSNPRALVDSPRNITDEQIRRCAERRSDRRHELGPAQLQAGDAGAAYPAELSRCGRLCRRSCRNRPCRCRNRHEPRDVSDGDLIRDRNSRSSNSYSREVEASPRSKRRYVEGFDDYGQLLEVVEAMRKRGFSASDVEKILGGNLLRVFREVWGG